jgi:YHS domain-containing protein
MLRAVLYILVGILLLSFLRSIAGILGKAFTGMLEPDSGRRAGSGSGQPKMSGELKRDPICGTYVSTAVSIKKTVGGEVLHFCSPACRDKYDKRT